MKRKTIAVCVTGYNWEYETRVVNGIYERCKELDINLLAFANLMRRPELNSDRVLPESVVRGEIEIYNLINYDRVDGIIILGDSMIEESIIYDIAEKAKQRGIPVVNINDEPHKLYRNIILSDKIAMEFVVRHLIEEHGYTKINFIGGFPGNLQTEERLAAYKKVLSEHNIPIEESRIAYGEFWKKSVDCTAEFMKADEKPQAIACASDTMAFFCMDYLKSQGYRIPEDIAVTGFDGIKECEEYNPSLTTVRRAFQESGSKAVDVLYDIFQGKETPEYTYIDSKLIKNHSCGCEVSKPDAVQDFFTEKYGELNIFKEFNTYILEMNTKFASAQNSTELYSDTVRGAHFFKLKKLYICICSNIEKGAGRYGEDDEKPAYCGLSDKMVSMLKYGHDIPIGTEFSTSELLPENLFDGDKCVFIGFSPIYFKDSFLGYLAYEPQILNGAGDFFATWLMAISNNAGSFYMKNELEYVVKELENLYIRDPLTGLYNRRGMVRQGREVLENVQKNGGKLTVMCADIDGLKPINDQYGHEAGDNAILRTAEAIKASMPDGSVCTRTGGDEFCVMLSYPGDDVSKFADAIDKFLDNYNSVSGLPYKVGCSCGFCSVSCGEMSSVDEVIKMADANMYKTKAERKKKRK